MVLVQVSETLQYKWTALIQAILIMILPIVHGHPTDMVRIMRVLQGSHYTNVDSSYTRHTGLIGTRLMSL